MTSKPNRDQMLERQLRRALQSGADAPATEACLDAEKLAIWVDGGLDSGEARAIERHVSSCARCQSLVAVMARTEPLEPVRAAWWRRWPAWVVPLTAGAAAALLWMVVPEERTGAPAGKVEPRIESARARAEAPSAPEPPPAPAEPMPSSELRQAPAREEATAGARDQLAGAERAAELQMAKPQMAQMKPAAPVPPKSEAAANELRLQDRRADEKARGSDRVAAPAAPRAEPVGAAPQAQTFGRVAVAEAPAIEIPSSNASVRWRLTGGAGVERTTDGGTSWEALATGSSAPLVAGSSPSPEVCWLVGRGGTVLLTTDARRWQQVPFPETVDLVAVRASDARTATITTADGRTFRTSDGGATWTR